MHKEIAEKWIAELESGEHLQGTNYLCTKSPTRVFRYCCLGVLEEHVLGLQKNFEPYKESALDRSCQVLSLGEDEDVFALSELLLEQIGMKEESQGQLQHMNDHEKKTFPEIAQFIRVNWETL